MDDLKSAGRTQPLSLWRHSAYLSLRLWTTSTYPRIAALFNGRDHTSVVHGVQEATKILCADIEPVADLLERHGVLKKYQKEKDLILESFNMVAWAVERRRNENCSKPEIAAQLMKLTDKGLIVFEEDMERGHKDNNILVRVKSGAMLIR